MAMIPPGFDESSGKLPLRVHAKQYRQMMTHDQHAVGWFDLSLLEVWGLKVLFDYQEWPLQWLTYDIKLEDGGIIVRHHLESQMNSSPKLG